MAGNACFSGKLQPGFVISALDFGGVITSIFPSHADLESLSLIAGKALFLTFKSAWQQQRRPGLPAERPTLRMISLWYNASSSRSSLAAAASADARVCVKWHFIGTNGTNGHPSSRTVDGTHDAIDSSRRDVICQQQFASRKRRDRPEGGRRFDDVLLQATFLEGSQLPTLRSSATPPPAAIVIPMVNIGGCQVRKHGLAASPGKCPVSVPAS